jgi:hypothetical protein
MMHYHGVIYFTEDYGKTWTLSNTLGSYESNIWFNNKGNGFVNVGQYVWTTTDTCKTWKLFAQPDSLSGDVSAVNQVSSGKIFLAGSTFNSKGRIQEVFCQDSSNSTSTNSQATIIKSLNNLGGTSIFPNPSNGRFTLNFSEGKSYQIKVYNSFGQELNSLTTEGSTIEMNIPDVKGIYYVNISTQNNAVSHKLTIE